ncbi:MAG: alanine:cation symporter family protein [Bacteroidia bacterium]|nr:alanine:cation symporter family protein [Bacteroidia bacterium]
MKKILSIFSLLLLSVSAHAESIDKAINDIMSPLTNWISQIVFFTVTIPFTEQEVPFVLIWLLFGAIFFTFYFRFVNIRHFKTAIDVVRGKYTDPKDSGEVSHFQALTAALSGTVGLGNIAGVAIAISLGGPGATFWMILAGLLGMSSKFVECTLGVKYREIHENGKVLGGPMYYLSKGLKERGFAGVGKFTAVFFAIMCIGGSFGGGNMFQVNQAFKQFQSITQSSITSQEVSTDLVGKTVYNNLINNAGINREYKVVGVTENTVQLKYLTALEDEFVTKEVAASVLVSDYAFIPLKGYGWVFGIVIAMLVAIVIIGGIKSIASVTDKIVPIMCGIYVLAAIVVLGYHFGKIPAAFSEIISGAFSPVAVAGGFVGVLIQGFKRAAFSNEAGIGSASIAHAAVKTNNPASEGLVALLEPFIDTVIVCTMTALVIVITGMDDVFKNTYENIEGFDSDAVGVALTSEAFASVLSWFPYILGVAVILFAFSTMITWSYYGEQAAYYLFGDKPVVGLVYKIAFCLIVILGAAMQLGAVVGFSDAMIFAMCFPNLIGLYILAPKVQAELKKYLNKIKTGEIKTMK